MAVVAGRDVAVAGSAKPAEHEAALTLRERLEQMVRLLRLGAGTGDDWVSVDGSVVVVGIVDRGHGRFDVASARGIQRRSRWVPGVPWVAMENPVDPFEFMSKEAFDWERVKQLTHFAFPDEIARLSESQRRARVSSIPGMFSINFPPAMRKKPRDFTEACINIPVPMTLVVDLRFQGWVEIFGTADLLRFAEARHVGDYSVAVPCRLANEIPGYPGSRGIPGKLKLREGYENKKPFFTADPGVQHSFAVDQREGFSQEQLRDWLVTHAAKASA